MAQPDLTAASLMFGKLIDTQQMGEAHRERIDAALLARCRQEEIHLTEGDIVWVGDTPTIDGMNAVDWVDAMTMD